METNNKFMGSSKKDDDALGIIYDDYTEKVSQEDTIDVSLNNLANKSLQLSNSIQKLGLRLEGYVPIGNGEKMVYTGKPLMGVDSIQQTMFLLEPFSSDNNLISNKKTLGFLIQNLRTRTVFNTYLFNGDVPAIYLKTLWRSFTNFIVNIGDIVTANNSKDLIKSLYGANEGVVESKLSGDSKKIEV